VRFLPLSPKRQDGSVSNFFQDLGKNICSLQPAEAMHPAFKSLAQGHNKQIYRPISTLSLLNAERQAGKL